MELKDVFGEIEADGAHLVHGRLLKWALTPPLWHAEAVGGRPHHQAPLGRVGTNLHCVPTLPRPQQETVHDEMRNFSCSVGRICFTVAGWKPNHASARRRNSDRTQSVL